MSGVSRCDRICRFFLQLPFVYSESTDVINLAMLGLPRRVGIVRLAKIPGFALCFLSPSSIWMSKQRNSPYDLSGLDFLLSSALVGRHGFRHRSYWSESQMPDAYRQLSHRYPWNAANDVLSTQLL